MEEYGMPAGTIIVYLLIIIVVIAGMWKTFAKAGHPGWAAIVPIYNMYVLCKIGDKPGWWVILMLIPIVNIIIAVILGVAVAENFGKGAGFGVGLGLLSFIFYRILGFGDAVYKGGERDVIDNLVE